MLELQADYIRAKVDRLEAEDLDRLEVRPEAMEAYAALQERIAGVAAWRHVGSRCDRHESGPIVTQFPGTMAALRELLATPDDDAYTASAPGVPEQEAHDLAR
jgi:hypothetical protein